MIAVDARAQVFAPFTHVDDACPKCSGGPAYDRITIDGEDVRAVVVAENEAFVVLMRFGELRAVGRDHVRRIDRDDKAVRPAGYGDQILMADGTVRAGTLKTDPATGDFIDLAVPETPLHHISRAAVVAVYRGGKRVWAK